MLKKFLLLIKSIRASHNDAKLNRKMIGKDRYGNQYYQYYDNAGKEAKRLLEVNPHASESHDPLWNEWLRYRQKTPFTQEQLNNLYELEGVNKKKAFDYEIKDAEIMKEFRKENKKVNESEKSSVPKGIGENYNPGIWKAKNVENSINEKKN